MFVRKTQMEDVDKVIGIINKNIAYFKEAGIDQWQHGYPNRETIISDVKQGISYVLEDEGEILGTCVIIYGEEPTYSVMLEGAWLNDEPYGVIHRIAVDPEVKGKGLAYKFYEYAKEKAMEQGIYNLRIDTHEDNKSMQKWIQKCGFEYTGIICVKDGLRKSFHNCFGK